jgi:hypothetical protein
MVCVFTQALIQDFPRTCPKMNRTMTADGFTARFGTEMSKRLRSDMPIYLMTVFHLLNGYLLLQRNNVLHLVSYGPLSKKGRRCSLFWRSPASF